MLDGGSLGILLGLHAEQVVLKLVMSGLHLESGVLGKTGMEHMANSIDWGIGNFEGGGGDVVRRRTSSTGDTSDSRNTSNTGNTRNTSRRWWDGCTVRGRGGGGLTAGVMSSLLGVVGVQVVVDVIGIGIGTGTVAIAVSIVVIVVVVVVVGAVDLTMSLLLLL